MFKSTLKRKLYEENIQNNNILSVINYEYMKMQGDICIFEKFI